MFEKVDQKVNFPDLEKQVLAKWKEEGTFQKSLELRAGRPRFVFYEGPPTANGKPATHHILARAFKDLFPRYKTMKGFYVERKAGWDTHGLPVEIEIEKKLGISGKFEIENEIGIERFNQLCRDSVYEYVDDWVVFSERMGFWLDYDNAYWTLTSDYIQSVWWALSEMWKQGLVYKGFRVAPYCPRCATPLSSHELAQGYRDNVPDPSVFIRFRLKNDPKTSILAWTTTPWTLPGNVALAVGPDVDYVKVRQGNEFLILAQARLEVLDGSYEIVERMKGEDLVGLDYEPLYPYSIPSEGRAHYVVDADFVSTEEGTGVVHTSALYGVDDLRISQEKGIPFRHTVGLDGKFLPYVEKFAGLHTKEADPLIIDDLKARGLLYRAGTILHTYPECWRCKTPLIYYALDSWYVRTTERKSELIANNNTTYWVPAHIKTGRMGDWLENNVDWAISRSRYWGTPIPIWVCEQCEEQRMVSSAAEIGLADDADLHRPYIDSVTLPCEKCGGTMRRIPEVLDAWFDSGSMPFAQRGYPRKGKKEFEETFPAAGDLIGRHRQKAAISEAMKAVGEVNKYITDTAPWTFTGEDQRERLATVLHVLAQCVVDLNTILSPFLPHAANAVDRVYGGTGNLQPMPRIEEVSDLDDGSRAYPVITGDYSGVRAWRRTPVAVGASVAKPTLVFTKLNPSVVNEELAGLA